MQLNPQIESVEKHLIFSCPHCQSVFVTENQCESCGYQFKVDRLGEPYGNRSFFNMFSYQADPYYWLSPGRKSKDKAARSHYLRQLFFRLSKIFDYLFGEIEADLIKRKHFLFEAKEIINEFTIQGGDSQKILGLIKDQPAHGTYQAICGFVSNAGRQRPTQYSIFKKIWSWQALDVPWIRIFTKTLFVYVPVIISSVLLFNYLIVSH
ncbi:MAG: hypothetical protein HN509_18635 [Halobacteriovoraceae bacterium]|nr:hypothetical protein [Halobacteriovoraceae bacterium]MBT5092832.1 hypothetical protein [Halobacteriovoraceae bacterium]